MYVLLTNLVTLHAAKYEYAAVGATVGSAIIVVVIVIVLVATGGYCIFRKKSNTTAYSTTPSSVTYSNIGFDQQSTTITDFIKEGEPTVQLRSRTEVATYM